MPGSEGIQLCKYLPNVPQESKSGELELFDDDEDALTGMLKYIYGQDPFQGRSDGVVTWLSIYYDVRLFEVAGKYQLDDLVRVASETVKEKLSSQWEHASFPRLLRTIYVEMPAHGGQLRDGVKEVCRKHIGALMQKKDFKEAMLELPDLMFDLLAVVGREQVRLGA